MGPASARSQETSAELSDSAASMALAILPTYLKTSRSEKNAGVTSDVTGIAHEREYPVRRSFSISGGLQQRLADEIGGVAST